MSAEGATGYGPRHRLLFDGDEDKYELWEVKFLGHMRLQKLHDVIVKPAGEQEGQEPSPEKLSEAFAQLVQYLDDRSLSLIHREAKDDGRKALQILRDHYLGHGKPRVIALYTELTTLVMAGNEKVTDYVIRAETASNSLKMAGETVSDSLLIAMMIKGLPNEFKTFSTVITQNKQPTLAEFKIALRNFEETEKYQGSEASSSSQVMKISGIQEGRSFKCFSCGKLGHKSYDCPQSHDRRPRKRWCSNCRSVTHDTQYCRKTDKKDAKKDNFKETKRDSSKDFKKKDSAKLANEDSYGEQYDVSDNHEFAFKISCDKVDLCSGGTSADTLLVDCGATAHIVTDKSKFVKFDENFNARRHVIELADGSRSSVVQGRGLAKVVLYDVNGRARNCELNNALYIPSYKQDIFSVQAATEKGASVSFTAGNSELRTSEGTVFDVKKKGKLYFLNSVAASTKVVHSQEMWHKILGHCNMKDVFNLEKISGDMEIIKSNENFDCDVCILGKMTQFRNRQPDRRATKPLELVHSDLAGPIDPTARQGFRYAMCFVDDFSGANLVYFLKQKSDAVIATEKFLADVAPYGEVKCIRSDNGTEYTSEKFRNLLVSNRIKHETSAPYSPHQNGTAERGWRSLFEMARCLLIEAKLPKYLWTYAVNAAAYIRNRCFNSRTGETPLESLTGLKPKFGNMHIFGSVCYAYIQNKLKLDARSEKGLFIGYDRNSPAYLVYFPERNDVKRVRCVKFTDKFEVVSSPLYENDVSLPVKPNVDEVENEVENEIENENDVHINDGQRNDVQADDVQRNVEPRYPRREHVRPKYLDDFVSNVSDDNVNVNMCNELDYCYMSSSSDVPTTYEDAISSPQSREWQDAMNEEISALEDNDTYEIVPLPVGQTVVGGRWVYALKTDQNGDSKFKARYVAKGYSQVPGVDFNETFAPTARFTSIRLLMQIALQENLSVHQMDVKSAYLNAPIDCDLYMQQPEGYEQFGKDGEKLVFKLKRSLYGLKQSGRNWNTMMHDYLTNEGFERSLADPCVYTRNCNMKKVIIVIWVDDIIVAASDSNVLEEVKQSLKRKFKMKDLGQLSWFLGIGFQYEKDSIVMSQRKFLERILVKFKMEDCTPKATPCDLNANKIKCEDSSEMVDPKLYREIVGSLIYVMTGTRPDLCYVISLLSQYMAKPTKAHLGMAKHVLRYIKGTLDYGLRFEKSEEGLSLVGFCDSDWGSSEDRHSVSGYVFQACKNGTPISWRSQKQRTIALSTCEAEYISLASATQEAKFLYQVYEDMFQTGESVQSVNIHVDNQGAISLAKNPVHHKRTKHIDIKYHFVREEVQKGFVKLTYVPTEINVADAFTKPLSKVRLNRLLDLRC